MLLSGCTTGGGDRTTTSQRADGASGDTATAAPGPSTGSRTPDSSSPSAGSVARSSEPGGGSSGGSDDLAAQVPTAASMASVRNGLPADPIDATDALVAKVFGSDEQAATAATAEILRRAGLPLVGANAPILAMPDHLVIVNHQIPVEMIPSLTQAIRSGQQYTPAQVGRLLQMAGATDRTLTGAQVVAILSAWGKDPKDGPEVTAAAAAERALGEWHHQLLNPATVVDPAAEQQARDDLGDAPTGVVTALGDPWRITGLDPMQVLLLLAHATSYVETVQQATSGPTTAGAAPTTGASTAPPGLRRPDAGPTGTAPSAGSDAAAPHSDAVCSFLDFQDDITDQAVHGVVKTSFRLSLVAAAKLALKVSKQTASFLGKAFIGYDIATDVLTTILLLTGVQTAISFTPGTTHFRHLPQDQSRDAAFTATVTFHSALQGSNGQYHGCWRFAGVKMPQNGPIKGWLVHWNVTGPVVVLRTDNLPNYRYPNVNQPTDADGRSVTLMEPRTEKTPPPPGQQDAYPVHMMVNQISARPDPNQHLLQGADVLNLGAWFAGGVAGVLILELEKVINRLVQNHALPATVVPYPVSYHLKEPFAINADGVLTIPLYTSMHMVADLHSCTGPGGPFTGTITFSEVAGSSVTAMEKLFGVSGKDSGQFTKTITFSLDPHSGGRQMIHIPTDSGDMGIWLQLDQKAIDKVEHQDTPSPLAFPVVGNGSWTFGGHDVTAISDLLGPAYSNGLSLPIVATPLDPRCKVGTLQDDHFDQN